MNGVNRKKQSILDVLREILSTPAFSRDKIIDDWVDESRVAPFVVIVTDEYKLRIEQNIAIYMIDLKANDNKSERALIQVRDKCKHAVFELDDDERVDIAYRAGESLAKVIDAYEKSLKKCNPSEETYIYLTEDDIIKIEKSESDAYPRRYNIIAIMPHRRAKLFRECYVEFGLRDHSIEIDPAITEIYDLDDAELIAEVI